MRGTGICPKGKDGERTHIMKESVDGDGRFYISCRICGTYEMSTTHLTSVEDCV